MKKITSILLIISTLAIIISCQQLTAITNGVLQNGGALTESEIVQGLKEALKIGITNGSQSASATDGFLLNPKIKIPFPPEVQKVEKALRDIGLSSQVDKFVTTLNRGAEDASAKAKDIFVNAILQMSITDAIGILKGDKDAATQFLKRTTSQQLINEFSPIIDASLGKTNATKYYGDITKIYNAIPFTEKVNSDLKQYATQKAIDGLFVLVAEEEAKIRENPAARVTDILKRVFGAS